ncbi:hypothetical protein [Methylocystis echinoides]|uniref:CdiA C-terminal domain-containing protein n=1 Tax=Methylocystis echinoides TaxID=29468 RepID=UPI003D8158CC
MVRAPRLGFLPSGARTSNVRSVWNYANEKVTRRQSDNIVINLADTPLTVEQIILQFRTWPIPGLKTVLLIDQNTKLYYLIGGR